MRITRYPSLTEQQFFGCISAFADSLTGELHAAAIALRRLDGRGKGSAFAHEMELDQHRYGALIVLDRWSTVTRAFGPHLHLSKWPEILTEAGTRIAAAEAVLARANQLLDVCDHYDSETLEAAKFALQSVGGFFHQESQAADQMAKLGPMLSDDYKESRQIFLEDLAAR